MSDDGLKDLERRVARLERLLGRVLELLQEGRGGADSRSSISLGEAGEGESARSGTADDPRVGSGFGPLWPPAPGETPSSPGQADPPPPFEGRRSWGRPEDAPAGERRSAPRRPAGRGVDWESLLSFRGPVLSRLGIGLLLLSLAFFFKYSIDQGWLVPWTRIAIGFVAGTALLALGFRGAKKGDHLGMALAGGGIATFLITGYAAYQLFSLLPYAAAFGVMVAASGLGVFLSLRSGRQTLAMVGLVGALATPILLTPEEARLAGFALYVSLIVATVVGIYVARRWRALLVAAVIVSWPVLGLPLLMGPAPAGLDLWAVQAAIALCALVYWLVPTAWEALSPREPAPAEPASPPPPSRRIPWSAHLDALSLLMPVVGILFSAALWEVDSRIALGWLFFGGALLAQGFGWWLSRREDPLESATTQWGVAVVLSTVGLGLVLSGDVLYMVFIAETAVLTVVGIRKRIRFLRTLGVIVGAIVGVILVQHLGMNVRLLAGDLAALLDLAALGMAVVVARELEDEQNRIVLLVAAYIFFLGWIARELLPLAGGQAYLSLAWGVVGAVVLTVGHLKGLQLAQRTGMATLFLVVGKLLLVDMAAVEPIWRVLLFALFGALFLALSRMTQGRRGQGQ